MQNRKYLRSRIPLSLVLLFLLNVFLVMGVELLFFYKYPANPDEAVLGKYDPAYVGCTIISSDTQSSLGSYLVQTSDGSTLLLVIKSHPIVCGRAKLIYAEPVSPGGESGQTVYVKNGIHTSEIVITNGSTVTIRYGYTGSFRNTTTWYMVIAAIMEAAELVIWEFIKRNLR